jgi:WD40 repeat protein
MRGHVVLSRKEPARNMTDLSWSEDGTRLLMSDLTGHLRLLDATSLRPVGSTARLGRPVGYALLRPDDHTAFVTTRDHPLEPNEDLRFDKWMLVDVDTGHVVRRGDLGPDQGMFAALSPDGSHAAVTGSTGELDVVDIRTGTVTRSLGRGDQLTVTPFVAFSPDGERVVTSAGNGAVTLYDADTVQVVDEVTTGKDVFTYAQFRPGTQDVAIADQDGQAALWDTSEAHAVDFACRIAGRDLTSAEWRTYLGDRPREAVCPAGE